MTRRPTLPNAGTVLKVLAVSPPGRARPPVLTGEPNLMPVGLAVCNPDRTITVWIEAVPISGTLLLRPCWDEGTLGLLDERPALAADAVDVH